MGKGKKFDICLMNPPYDKGLHEKFFIKTLDVCDSVITIQPSNWLFGNRKNKEILKRLRSLYCEIDRIKNPGKYFLGGGAAIGNDLSINYVNNNLSTCLLIDNIEMGDIDNLNIYKFTGDKLLEEFNNIISSLYNKDNVCKHILSYDNQEYSSDDSYCIKIPRIRGHKYGKSGEDTDFYTIISNNNEFVKNETCGIYKNLINSGKRSNFNFYIKFDTNSELNHFINYLKSDFCRAALYLLKVSQNVTGGRITRYIPWFDFSDSVFSKTPKEIDDYLFKKYDISDEIRHHIEEILPDYYNIR